MNKTERKEYELASELKSTVEKWVDKTFNFIRLEVYEKMAGECGLFDYIRQEPASNYADDWWNSQSDLQKQEWMEECEGLADNEGKVNAEVAIEHFEDNITEFIQNNRCDSDNYPMWSTLFEFKDSPPSDWLDKAQEVGLGVIEIGNYGELAGLFNDTLFASSAGHSFYSAYWIPLYLSIFREYSEDLKKYDNVSYQMV